MKAYSIPALIIATICLTFAISDTLAWVRRNKKSSDIAFILICLGGAGFCLCCAGEYNVDFPFQSIFWLRGEVISSTISGFALLWFVAETTRLVDRRVVWLSLLWAVLSLLSQVFDLGDLTWIASKPLVLHVDLPFGLDFVYREVERGIILVIIASGGFAFQLYLLGVVIRFRLSGNRKESLVLFAVLGFILTAQILDFFIGIGAISFVFLLEYAWLATVLVVGLKRSNDYIEAALTKKMLAKTDLELKVSQTTLSTIIDSTDDMIWSVDADSFNLLTCNKSFRDHFCPGYAAPVSTGLRFEDLLDSPEEKTLWQDIYRQGLEKGAYWTEYKPSGQDKVYLVGANNLHRDGKIFGLSVFAHNITERTRAEEQVRRALSEKEVLLKEVHHRTKNNMNVIVSILRLQANHMADQRLKDAYAVSIDRIITMSLVHNRLYLSGDLSRIDLKEYLKELADRLLASHALPDKAVTLHFELASVYVMIDTAINCGMIVNELVTNALKHAFAATTAGTITIRLGRCDNQQIELCVSDNGIGLPQGFNPEHDGNLGHTLIHTLARDSLHAELEFNTDAGLACTLRFPLQDPETASGTNPDY